MKRGWIASLGISAVSAIFPRRNAIRVDSADFLGSSVVPGIASLGISTVTTTFPGRSVLGQTVLASWEAVLSQGMPPWELVLLVLPSPEGILLGWTALTS